MLLISPALLPSAVLGEATQVLLSSSRNLLSLASVYAFLAPPIALSQIAFKYDHKARPLGYVTWAFLTDEVLADLDHDPSRRLELPEWNEGTHLFIVDLVSLDGDIRGLLGLMDERCQQHRTVLWRARSDRGGLRRRALKR